MKQNHVSIWPRLETLGGGNCYHRDGWLLGVMLLYRYPRNTF